MAWHTEQDSHQFVLVYIMDCNPEFVLQVCGNWKWVITSFERFPLLPFADLTTLFGSFTFITTNWPRSQLNRSWYSRNSLCWICQVSIPFYPDMPSVCTYLRTDITNWRRAVKHGKKFCTRHGLSCPASLVFLSVAFFFFFAWKVVQLPVVLS